MSDRVSLPFAYTNKSISEWLSQFDTSDVLLMSNEVFKVLSVLKKHHKKIDPAALAIVVKRLTPVVMHLSTSLIKAIINHSQARKVAHMGSRILYYLAFLHLHLARKVKLKVDKVLHTNYAVQMAGISFQHCALGYHRPSGVLWECLGQCYELAKNEHLLDMAVNKPSTDLQALTTTSLALKRILLFWVANPFRLCQQDMLVLFSFCTENCSLVSFIQSGITTEQVFYWEYRVFVGYQPVNMYPAAMPDDCVVFNIDALVNFEHKQNLPMEATDLVMASFDQYRSLLENTPFTLSRSSVFASRFDFVIDFLARHVRQHRVLIINTPVPEDLNFSSLALIKEKNKRELPVEKVSSTDIWNYYKEEKDEDEALTLEFGAMKLVQSDLSLFNIAETMAVKLRVGDLFICYDSALTPVLGIARRVESRQKGDVQKSVVELCQGQLSVLQQSGLSVTALLLENEDEQQLFVVPAKYETGKVLKFDQADVVLQRLLEISPYFMRYRVSV